MWTSNHRRDALRALGIGALLCAWAVPARAQIYSWRDAAGHLVLSDRPGAHVERTFAVPRADSVRTTREAAPERGRSYDAVIEDHARRHDVRSDLVRAVVQVESAFNPYARSPKGALGLMQLMPATIRRFGVVNAFNPEENVRAGVTYLRELLDRYQDNEQLALAAYNAGPGAVDKYGQTVPPYRETQDYVSRISRSVSPVRSHSTAIYKTVEIVDGHQVVRYSNQKPASGSFEVVQAR
jgi:soluble lytic murein transglycosylase-like protein